MYLKYGYFKSQKQIDLKFENIELNGQMKKAKAKKRNIDHLNDDKYHCECGSKIVNKRANINKHNKTQKHQRFIEKQEAEKVVEKEPEPVVEKTPVHIKMKVKTLSHTASKQASYRLRKREAMGEKAFKKMQSEKRQARRLKKRSTRIKEQIEAEAKQKRNRPLPPKPLPPIPKQPEPLPEIDEEKSEDDEVVEPVKKDHPADLRAREIIKKTKEMIKKPAPAEIINPQYVKRLEYLHKLMGIKSKFDIDQPGWLTQLEGKVKSFLEKTWKNINSRSSYLIAIVVYALKKKELKKLHTEALAYLRIVSDQSQKRRDQNLPAPTKGESHVSWDTLLKAWNKNKDKLDLRDRAIVALYLLQIPRRLKDYQMMKVVDYAQPVDKKFNYVVLEEIGMGTLAPVKFIFHNYKTAKKFGTQTVKIDNNELIKVLYEYIESLFADGYNDDFLLFPSKGGKKLPSFGNRLTIILEKLTGNKNLSMNSIRHSYINSLDFNKLTDGEKKKIATGMGHGVSTQSAYRIL